MFLARKRWDFCVLFVIIFCVVGRVYCTHTTHNRVPANSGSSYGGGGGFSGVVKQVMKNGTNVHPVTSNVGVPLDNSERIRIIGGVETARNEFPFIVSFSRHGKHFCGGAIIAPEWVLTAAHCASEPTFDVTAGEHNLDVMEGPEQKSKAVVVIRHAKYNPNTYEDDICLVKVSPPFNYNNYVQPFAVPSTHYVANGHVTVAGWGTEDEAYQVVSPVLRKVTVPLVPSLQCAAQYGSYFHPLKMICAGEEEGGKDACQGDSGGPLMCEDTHSSKGAILCGVVSFGLGCARPELAGVYTKVAYYSDWIEYEMRMNSANKNGLPAPPPPTRPPYVPPPKATPAPPPAPGQSFPDIPPGYIVIIKPQSTQTQPTAPPYYPPIVHRNKTRSRSGSSRVHSYSIIDSILVFSSLALAILFEMNN